MSDLPAQHSHKRVISIVGLLRQSVVFIHDCVDLPSIRFCISIPYCVKSVASCGYLNTCTGVCIIDINTKTTTTTTTTNNNNNNDNNNTSNNNDKHNNNDTSITTTNNNNDNQ